LKIKGIHSPTGIGKKRMKKIANKDIALITNNRRRMLSPVKRYFSRIMIMWSFDLSS
jgi:hypothetical protein